MPPHTRHREQRAKNLVLLGLLFAMVGLFFVLALIKFGGL